MPKFRTQFQRKRVKSPVSSSVIPEFKLSLDSNGSEILVQCGERDIYPEIQSHAKSVDINEIVLRYQRGDLEVLAQRAGTYMDLTNMPTSYAELYQRVLDAEEMFNDLPLEIRQKFDHSFSKFFSQIGTPAWSEAMEIMQNNPVSVDPVPVDSVLVTKGDDVVE